MTSLPRRLASWIPAFLFTLWIVFTVHRAWSQSYLQANDFNTYYGRSLDTLAGKNPYALHSIQSPYIYPPLLLWLFAPFTFLSAPLAAAAWACTILAAIVLQTAIIQRLTRTTTSRLDLLSQPWLLFAFAPFLICLRFLLREVSQGQVNGLVVLVTVLALLALVHGRDLLAGTLLGMGAVLKILPLVFLMPLVLWHRWRAVLAMVIAIPVFLVLPAVSWGPARQLELMKQWRTGHFLEHASDVDMDTHSANQSLWAWSRRTFSAASATPPFKDPVYVNVVELSARTASLIHTALALLLTLVSAFALRRASTSADMVAGWALSWNLVHLVSKKTWEEHLVTMVLVFAVLIARSRYRFVWAVPAALIWCHAPFLVGTARADVIQMYSPTCIALVMTALGLLHVLFASQASEALAPAPCEGTAARDRVTGAEAAPA